MMSHPTPFRRRASSWLLIGGAALLIAGNVAHPIDADPSALSRFEFATHGSWIPIHLALAVAFLVLTAGLVAFLRTYLTNGEDLRARLATVGALIGGTLLFVVFGAFDGYAVASLAADWVAAEGAELASIETAAVALDAIDTGSAAVGTLSLMGIAVGASGLLVLARGGVARWLGWSGIVAGIAGTVAGIGLLVEGPTDVTINLLLRPAAVAATLWFLALGIGMRKVDLATEPESADRPAASSRV